MYALFTTPENIKLGLQCDCVLWTILLLRVPMKKVKATFTSDHSSSLVCYFVPILVLCVLIMLVVITENYKITLTVYAHTKFHENQSPGSKWKWEWEHGHAYACRHACTVWWPKNLSFLSLKKSRLKISY
jgi:hypothetical protein